MFLRVSSSLSPCPDLVKRIGQQVRLVGLFGFDNGVPWFINTDAACWLTKTSLLIVLNFKKHFGSLWSYLDTEIISVKEHFQLRFGVQKSRVF